MYNIPLFDLNYGEEEKEAVLETLDSKWISMGPKCAELERKFCEMLGSSYAVAVSSCTAALHLAMKAIGLKSGDEVIVPALTFVATVNAIRYVGAIPVFCDIEDIDKIVVDPKQIEDLITEKTKAIVVMHYAGFPCDMDKIMEIAKRYKLRVIEDACHAPLSEYHNRKLGTIGDIGCFSFFSNKNISTGEGGIIVTNSEKIFSELKLMRSHGMTTMSYERAKGHSTRYDVVELGYNYRLDDIRASIGVAQLDKLRPDIEKRLKIRRQYVDLLEKTEKIIIPFAEWGEFSASYIFPIVLKNSTCEQRDLVRDYLAQHGIQTSVHYPPVHRFRIYEQYSKNNLPNTEYVADCEITLPMYGNLKSEEVDYICDSLIQAISEL